MHKGWIFISRELQRHIIKLSKQIKQEVIAYEDLTERELEVLKVIVNELKSAEIANQLGLHLLTIKKLPRIHHKKLGQEIGSVWQKRVFCWA